MNDPPPTVRQLFESSGLFHMSVDLGDCLDTEFPKAQLAYLDPPWGSGIQRTGKNGGYSDLLTGPAYLEWLVPRVLHVAKAVETGWIVLHMDPLIGARAMVTLEPFLGEAHGIVSWQDSWVSGFRSRASSFWPRIHDSLTFWRIGDAPFYVTTEPAPDDYKRRGGGGGTERVIGDLWIGPWSPGHLSFSKEKVGYPDQKPLGLLTRIIEATTDPGDMVIDPFCGSGSTLVAALSLERRAFGVDINPEAVEIAKRRVAENTFKKLNWAK